ncbi:MAG: 50S ribosomal protein L10 [DPANN group archaeon]|nr:50S ribosomal protein L10 [DPANN group archaeon]
MTDAVAAAPVTTVGAQPAETAETRVAEWKLKQVDEIAGFLKDQHVVGVIAIESLPSREFQELRKKLRGRADVKVARSELIRRAISKLVDYDLAKLTEHLNGPAGLIVSKEDPFKLFNYLKKNMSNASAKPGQLALGDIIVPAAETDMPAGPALAELKQAGLKVKLDKGKIVIAEDSIIVKAGEEITPVKASALLKLGIKPMKIGLQITALYKDGTIYLPEVLSIDEEQFRQTLNNAIAYSINLAVFAGYPTRQSIKIMLRKAEANSLGLANHIDYPTSKTIKNIIAKGGRRGSALMSTLEAKGYSQTSQPTTEQPTQPTTEQPQEQPTPTEPTKQEEQQPPQE